MVKQKNKNNTPMPVSSHSFFPDFIKNLGNGQFVDLMIAGLVLF